MVDQKILEEFVEQIKPADKEQNKTHSAIVSKIDEEGTVWVRVAGSVKDTPTQLVGSEVKKGDAVNVEWRNNKLYIANNYSNPAAGVGRVGAVEQAAQLANEAANNAITDAGRAKEAADSASASADQAKQDAAEAEAAAETANTAATGALTGLSTVQDVIGMLNWAAENATYSLTQDTDIMPGKTYWTKTGDVYTPVPNPVKTALSTYYEITGVDEAMGDFINAHLALTEEGLWILPDGMDTASYRVLIATGGQGHTYEDAGTYIIDSAGKIVAKLGEAITLGIDDGTQSHIELDYHSMRMISKEGDDYMHISDLRDESGEAVVSDGFATDGIKRTFYLSRVATNTNYEVTGEYQGRVTKETTYFTLETPPSPGKYIIATYSTRSSFCKAYTLGQRLSESPIGVYSFAEGYEVEASGAYSHAEGTNTGAAGRCSHAEGDMSGAHGYASHVEGIHSRANGDGSHAQNTYTIAAKESQTVIGKYNKEDTESDSQKQKALIIGNGTSENNRSNALAVDWQGRVECGDYSGNLQSIFDIFYPVGSYYETSDANFDPEVAWGGTWILETAGLVHVSGATNHANYPVSSTYTDANNGAGQKQGGDEEVTLTTNQIPAHTHGSSGGVTNGITGGSHHHTNYRNKNVASGSAVLVAAASASSNGLATTNETHTHNLPNHTHSSVGKGESHNNMQPYINVYRWHRTA